MNLDEAIRAAQSNALPWDAERAAKNLEAARTKREARTRRDRVLRRGAVVVAGAAILVLALFRSAAGQPEESHGTVAAIAMDDAGFERD